MIRGKAVNAGEGEGIPDLLARTTLHVGEVTLLGAFAHKMSRVATARSSQQED